MHLFHAWSWSVSKFDRATRTILTKSWNAYTPKRGRNNPWKFHPWKRRIYQQSRKKEQVLVYCWRPISDYHCRYQHCYCTHYQPGWQKPHNRVTESSIATKDVLLIISDVRYKFNPTPTHPTAQTATRLIPTHEHFISRIMNHATNTDNISLYQVRFCACGPELDTWGPLQHLRHRHIICYYQCKSMTVLDGLLRTRRNTFGQKKYLGNGVSSQKPQGYVYVMLAVYPVSPYSVKTTSSS